MDTRQYNMQYLNLNDEQYDRHCELMRMTLGNWPVSLTAYARRVFAEVGFSGDVLAVAVADWIRFGEPDVLFYSAATGPTLPQDR